MIFKLTDLVKNKNYIGFEHSYLKLSPIPTDKIKNTFFIVNDKAIIRRDVLFLSNKNCFWLNENSEERELINFLEGS